MVKYFSFALDKQGKKKHTRYDILEMHEIHTRSLYCLAVGQDVSHF